MTQFPKYQIVDIRDARNTRYAHNMIDAIHMCDELNADYARESPYDMVFKTKVFFILSWQTKQRIKNV